MTKTENSRTRVAEKIIAGMRMLYIPPGEFLMGVPPQVPDLRAEETPRHPVAITRGFYLAVQPVTQAVYQNVTGRNIADNKTDPCLPVESVNRITALKFCELLSAQSGENIRLPTEAEWEYACRAGTRTAYFWGDDPGPIDDYAWTADNAVGAIHPVALKKPNPWGLYDILGNVWEWCSDWFAPDYYGRSPVEDPPGPESGEKGILRGGSFFNQPNRVMCSSRGITFPEVGRSRYGLRPCVSA